VSALADDLGHVRDELQAARRGLLAVNPIPAVLDAVARLDAALPALEAAIDQVDELQVTAIRQLVDPGAAVIAERFCIRRPA